MVNPHNKKKSKKQKAKDKESKPKNAQSESQIEKPQPKPEPKPEPKPSQENEKEDQSEGIDTVEPELDLELECGGSALYEDYIDFYEGSTIGPILKRKLCKAVDNLGLAEYEQMVEGVGKMTERMFEFSKYEVYVMMYPTLAIAYLQMVWSGERQRARSLVEKHRHHLDDSYKRRMANLMLIRKPEDVPGRALELLTGADMVQFSMSSSTFTQFQGLQSKIWTKEQRAVFLNHFEINVHADNILLQVSFQEHPLPEPFSWASTAAVPDRPFDRNKLPRLCMNMAEPFDFKDDITCATLSKDNCSVAFGTDSGVVHVVAVTKDWEHPNNLRREKVFKAHQKSVLACAFSFDDSHLLSASEDRTMRLWCTTYGYCRSVYQHLASCVVFAPKGNHFATSAEDNGARVWAANTKDPVLCLYGHLAPVQVCVFHPNGNYWATGSADGTVRIWDYDNRAQVRLLYGHTAPVTALVYSACGRYLVSAGREDVVIVWDTSDEQILNCLSTQKAMVVSMHISCCNNMLAVWSSECQLSFYDFQQLVNFKDANQPPREGTQSPLICTLRAKQQRTFLTGGFLRQNGLVAIYTKKTKPVKKGRSGRGGAGAGAGA